jgi:hypothetical protein
MPKSEGLKGCNGGFDRNHRIIYINANISLGHALDTLMHEYGHGVVDCWGLHDWADEGHDEFLYGLLYGRIEKAWLDYGHEESRNA